MKTHVTGQPVLGELRQHALNALLGNPFFSEAEHVRANHFVHECEDIVRLTRWGASVRVEIARRAAEAARQRRYYATRDRLRHLRATPFRGHCLRPLPTWVVGVPLPDRADRRADTFDRRAAARFQPADARTFACLLSRQAR